MNNKQVQVAKLLEGSNVIAENFTACLETSQDVLDTTDFDEGPGALGGLEAKRVFLPDDVASKLTQPGVTYELLLKDGGSIEFAELDGEFNLTLSHYNRDSIVA